MHCPAPCYHVSEWNGKDEAMSVGQTSWTTDSGENLTCGTCFFLFALCLAVGGRHAWKYYLRKVCGSQDTRESERFYGTIWEATVTLKNRDDDPMVGVGEVLPPKTHTQGRALVWESRRLVLGSPCHQLAESLTKSTSSSEPVSSCVRESPPRLGFRIAWSWSWRSMKFHRSYMRPKPLPDFEAHSI